jgi:hypothetical protein
VVTVVLAAGGVLLAGRRRRAVVAAALGVAAGVAALGIGLSFFRIVYLDHLPANADTAAAGAAGAWLSGGGRWAGRVTAAWETGISAVRQAVGVTSLEPVGPWVHRYRRALRWAVVAGAALALLLWSYPTGMVVFWIALVAVAVLTVVEFLDDDRRQGGAAGVGSR